MTYKRWIKAILLDNMEKVNVYYPYDDRDIILADILNYEDDKGNIIECFVKFIIDEDNIMIRYIRINKELSNVNEEYNAIFTQEEKNMDEMETKELSRTIKHICKNCKWWKIRFEKHGDCNKEQWFSKCWCDPDGIGVVTSTTGYLTGKNFGCNQWETK